MAFRQKYYREQVDESDCGVACLAMILDYYGSYYSLATLRQQAKTTQEGTTELRLVETAETLGLDVRVVQADMSLFQYNDVPYPLYCACDQKTNVCIYNESFKYDATRF